MLKTLTIDSECFMYVNELKLIGMEQLERVEIGKNCFTKNKSNYGNNPKRHLYVKSCPKLKELKIDNFSFSDGTVCEIENVDALESIEMGVDAFYWSSLELKSILIHKE